MKILLIYPYFLDDRLSAEDVSVVPMGLYYVAAMLKAHQYQVDVRNWSMMRDATDEIEHILKDQKPDLVGLSLVHANRWGGIDIARMIKRLFPQSIVVAGGIGATFLWRHLLDHFREIDYVVLGEGEFTFLELTAQLAGQNTINPEVISGLAFRKNGRSFQTLPAEPIRDIDQLPDPAGYFNFQHVALTRGCPGKCSFCGSPHFWNCSVRSHSVDYFIDQLVALHRRGIRFFYVSDDTFTFRRSHTIKICKRIIEKHLDITWAAISRVNYVNEEMLYWMRRAGCIQISYGVESGSEKIRNYLNKHITTEQIERAFQLTVSYGIMARAYFIYGCKGESWQTIQDTIDLMDRIKPLSAIFYILDLYPGTDLYKAFQEETGTTDDIWLQRVEDIMYFETDPQLSAEMILAFGKKLRTHFYQKLPLYTAEIELNEDPELYPQHADFLARLAMTFDQGDYAAIAAIPHKQETAEKLYRRSLQFFPDPKAYLGLGILKQKARDYQGSIEFLSKGLLHFPDHKEINICTGVSYLNLDQPNNAMDYFSKFPNAEDVQPLIAACKKALGKR